MRKKTIAVICMFVMVFSSLAGCGSDNQKKEKGKTEKESGEAKDKKESGEDKNAETLELSIAHIGALESPSNQAVEKFIQLVDERFGGTIKVTNYPASQLGADREILEGIVGVTVYEPELEPFLEKVRPVLPEVTAEWGEDLYEKAQSYK